MGTHTHTTSQASDRRRPGAAAYLIIVLAALLMAGGLYLHESAKATAAPTATFYVNSADFGGPDTNPGDGVCDAGGSVVIGGVTQPRCTLRAAIEEANTMGWVSAGDVLITLAPGWAGGTITAPSATDPGFVYTNRTFVTAPLFFDVLVPMTIDLKNSLHTAVASQFDTVVFRIDSADVTVKNASGILSGNTAFLVNDDSATIDGGETVQSVRGWMQRFVVVAAGVKEFTLANYHVGGLFSQNQQQGAVVFADLNSGGVAIEDTLLDNVDFTSPQKTAGGTPSTTCTAADGSGCVNEAVVVGDGASLAGLEIRHCTMANSKYRGSYGFPFFDAYQAGAMSNINLHHNTLTNNVTALSAGIDSAVIVLPDNDPLTGVNTIANNVFDNSGVTGQPWGIGWNGALTGTAPSHLSIVDNYFDGFAQGGIILANTGLVSVQRNTFGPHNGSASPDILEETANASASTLAAMLVNYRPNTGSSTGANANEAITTWHPVASGPSLSLNCQLTVPVEAPSVSASTIMPSTPVQIDVYWTATTKAERYLGSSPMNITGTTGSVTVPVPADLLNASGQMSGKIRLQTQTKGPGGAYPQIESSQYSRTIGVPLAGCFPTPPDGDLSVVKQAWLGAAGLSYSQIMAPGHGGATEVISGSRLAPDTTVWFTYTLNYIYLDPKTGLPARTGQPGANGVAVTDSVLGLVCTINVAVNTPTGCVKQGTVSAQ